MSSVPTKDQEITTQPARTLLGLVAVLSGLFSVGLGIFSGLLGILSSLFGILIALVVLVIVVPLSLPVHFLLVLTNRIGFYDVGGVEGPSYYISSQGFKVCS